MSVSDGARDYVESQFSGPPSKQVTGEVSGMSAEKAVKYICCQWGAHADTRGLAVWLDINNDLASIGRFLMWQDERELADLFFMAAFQASARSLMAGLDLL